LTNQTLRRHGGILMCVPILFSKIAGLISVR
jgi:hypothetical protein